MAGAGSGFMLKPDRGEDYVDRITRYYVGLYVLRGRGRFTDWHGTEHAVAAGDLVQMPPDCRHSMVLEPDGRWAEFYFTLDRRWYEAWSLSAGELARRAVIHPGLHLSVLERCEAHLDRIKRGGDADVTAGMLALHGLLVELYALHRQGQSPSADAAAMQEARRALGEQLEKRLAMRSVAARLGMSYERFRKVFREHAGMPPGEYRIRRRLDRARSLILQDGLSNHAVAAALGYADAFTFSKQFRRYVGMTPRTFRRIG